MSSSSLDTKHVRGPARMSDARLVVHQLRYDLLGVWRDPRSRFFTIVLPLIFLVLLTSLFGNRTLHLHGHAIKDSTYYVPGISTLGSSRHRSSTSSSPSPGSARAACSSGAGRPQSPRGC